MLKKIARVILFLVFVVVFLFLNYLRDLALSTINSITKNFNIAVSTDGKTSIEVVSDRVEAALSSIGNKEVGNDYYIKIRRSQEIFEEYKKHPQFSSRVNLQENVFNDYILVYPGRIISKSDIEDIVRQIRNTPGVDEISYDETAVEVCIYLKDKVVKYVNSVIAFIIGDIIVICLIYLYIALSRKKSVSDIFHTSTYLTYLYSLVVAGALSLIGVSSIYRHSSLGFNWTVTGGMVLLMALAVAVIFQLEENG